MRKITLKRFVVTLCVACFIFLSNNDAAAQCTYKVINVKGDTASFTIPCDFPLKANTGDAAADNAGFQAAFLAWNKNSPSLLNTLPTEITTGIKKVIFEISEATLNTFDAARKAAILANPERYFVKP